MVMAGEPIAALLADEQAAQQILDARKPLAIALAACLQLLGDTREEFVVVLLRFCGERFGSYPASLSN
jgi:hypothetical protein